MQRIIVELAIFELRDPSQFPSVEQTQYLIDDWDVNYMLTMKRDGRLMMSVQLDWVVGRFNEKQGRRIVRFHIVISLSTRPHECVRLGL